MQIKNLITKPIRKEIKLMKMNRKERNWIISTGVIALFFGITPTANAMHIMEVIFHLPSVLRGGLFVSRF